MITEIQLSILEQESGGINLGRVNTHKGKLRRFIVNKEVEHYFKHYFGLYSGSTKVLPGPPKYLPYQCPHRARLVPEIVPEVVPDPPLHSAQIILAFRKKDFYVFNRNVFGHFEAVDRALFRALFGQQPAKELPASKSSSNFEDYIRPSQSGVTVQR